MAGLVRKINHFNIGFVLLPTTFVPFRNKNWSRKIEIDLIVIIHSDLIRSRKCLEIFLASQYMTSALSEIFPIYSLIISLPILFLLLYNETKYTKFNSAMQNLTRQGQTVL